ncbi:MAG: hypothetical protein AMXMBFR33_21440 [Candidatus Xenobia bacterium]|jgi:hypothetical protein
MIQPVGKRFPLLLEVPQPLIDQGRPADLYRAEYYQASEPALDRVHRLRALVDSSSDERHPIALSDGSVGYHSERERAGLYRFQDGLARPVLLRNDIDEFAARPDGKEWAFVADDSLYRVAPGRSPRCQELGQRVPRHLAYTPEGQLLMADRDALHRLEPDGSLVELARGTFEQFSVSRDGSQLVYLRPDAHGCQLRVLELHTGSDRLVKHSAGEERVYDYPEYRRPALTPDGSRILYAVTSLDGGWGAPLHCDLRVVGAEGGQSVVLCDEVLGAVCA